MTPLTCIQNPRYAQAFVDYLQTLGITAQAQPAGGTVAILVADASQLPLAQDELSRFLDEPDHDRYWQASWLVEDEQAASTLSRFYRAPSLWKFVKSTGWVTWMIMGLCIFVYVLTDGGEDVTVRAGLMFFASPDALLDGHEFWRWITPALLHFGIYHISFNLLGWWVFGGPIERAQSSARLLGLFLALAVIGNLAQFLWSGNQFGGLSGVVYGVLGYLWIYARVNPKAPFHLPPGMIKLMWIVIVLGFLPILPFASLAHFGGLLGGCALGAALGWLDRQEHPLS